jgi:hypothetical protein
MLRRVATARERLATLVSMKRILLATILPLAMLSVQLGPTKHARADVSLGASFGATVSFPKYGEERVGFGWPYSSAPAALPTPGIRFGFTGGSGKHEGYLDSTVSYASTYGERVVLLTVNYQYNVEGRGSGLYFTAGAGPLHYGVRSNTVTTLMVGAGVGLRQRVASGAGTFREELRFDFLPETSLPPDSPDGRVSPRGATFLLGFKLGFDLWFR